MHIVEVGRPWGEGVRGEDAHSTRSLTPYSCAQVLADQDWISFRPNVFALQDLASKWIEKIKTRLAEAQRADTVTEHIHQVLKTRNCPGGIVLCHWPL